MNKFRNALAITAVVLGATALTSGTAQAASSPIEACGGGSYHQIDSHKLGNVATIHLLYNGSTNCVVTWRTNPGTPIRLLAAIGEAGHGMKNDDDRFTTYAGPVKLTAPGRCIIWGGGVTLSGVWNAWYDGPSHCG